MPLILAGTELSTPSGVFLTWQCPKRDHVFLKCEVQGDNVVAIVILFTTTLLADCLFVATPSLSISILFTIYYPTTEQPNNLKNSPPCSASTPSSPLYFWLLSRFTPLVVSCRKAKCDLSRWNVGVIANSRQYC